jgi:hypothetical protein
MPFVVVTLASEYLPDGSFHVYSPNVPGFHVVHKNNKQTHEQLFHETALPILEETLTRRVIEAKVGERVIFDRQRTIAKVDSFVPDELRRAINRDRPFEIPHHIIAEIR